MLDANHGHKTSDVNQQPPKTPKSVAVTKQSQIAEVQTEYVSVLTPTSSADQQSGTAFWARKPKELVNVSRTHHEFSFKKQTVESTDQMAESNLADQMKQFSENKLLQPNGLRVGIYGTDSSRQTDLTPIGSQAIQQVTTNINPTQYLQNSTVEDQTLQTTNVKKVKITKINQASPEQNLICSDAPESSLVSATKGKASHFNLVDFTPQTTFIRACPGLSSQHQQVRSHSTAAVTAATTKKKAESILSKIVQVQAKQAGSGPRGRRRADRRQGQDARVENNQVRQDRTSDGKLLDSKLLYQLQEQKLLFQFHQHYLKAQQVSSLPPQNLVSTNEVGKNGLKLNQRYPQNNDEYLMYIKYLEEMHKLIPFSIQFESNNSKTREDFVKQQTNNSAMSGNFVSRDKLMGDISPFGEG